MEVAAYGEVVWSWHPLLMLSLAEAKPAQPGEVAVNPLGDGDKKEFVAEESTKETVKTIARGKPGDFRRNRGDYRVLTTNAHGPRVLRAPGFPCALCFEGQGSCTARALRAARSRMFARPLSGPGRTPVRPTGNPGPVLLTVRAACISSRQIPLW